MYLSFKHLANVNSRRSYFIPYFNLLKCIGVCDYCFYGNYHNLQCVKQRHFSDWQLNILQKVTMCYELVLAHILAIATTIVDNNKGVLVDPPQSRSAPRLPQQR